MNNNNNYNNHCNHDDDDDDDDDVALYTDLFSLCFVQTERSVGEWEAAGEEADE